MTHVGQDPPEHLFGAGEDVECVGEGGVSGAGGRGGRAAPHGHHPQPPSRVEGGAGADRQVGEPSEDSGPRGSASNTTHLVDRQPDSLPDGQPD